ncbi:MULTISPECIES: cell surface composition regulator GlgS [unclassified Pseudocitrobacter]|uniref:cell surface composition regulator GlgS n=1 Tax=unclassified Pseudocitrobacter TaxID=2638778 RepID=UPI0023E3E0B2|nr:MULTISPECIES: cell surface composition regulator GlgS [unclassified Pseudocitrobacter]MDF3830003.1 cell surface composition regulator GlgS [Pseudocitrobacter sp. 2023EL-00150]MEC5373884.1 cell surface composition regulator GlgS [Pseudocitrobacter sp. MW920760]
MPMKHSNIYSLNNFDFLAHSFARMHEQGQDVDLKAITGNMDEEHRVWFCKRYERYCRIVEKDNEPELEH